MIRYHYIEDDHLDAELLSGMFGKANDLELTISTNLSAYFDNEAGQSPVGGILVDIYRPDSISIENDVQAIRGVSNAPIVFVTDGKVSDFHERAIAAGAEGVFDKTALNPLMIEQFFRNTGPTPPYVAKNSANDSIRSPRLTPVWTNQQIAEYIKRERQRAGISPEILADQMNISVTQFQKFESGVNKIPASFLAHFAEVLYLSLDSMIQNQSQERWKTLTDNNDRPCH